MESAVIVPVEKKGGTTSGQASAAPPSSPVLSSSFSSGSETPQLLGTHISETAFLLFLLSSRLPSLVDTVDVVLKLLEDEQGVFGEGLCLPVKSSTSNLGQQMWQKMKAQRRTKAAEQ